MMDQIHEKLQIVPEFVMNINLHVSLPVYLNEGRILFATSTFIVEMDMQGNQKIHPFHFHISNLSYSKDYSILAVECHQESKVIFFDIKAMRKRRVLKEDQGIVQGHFIDNKRYAILTEKNHLRVYNWENSLLELECGITSTNPRLYQFDNGLILCDKNNTIYLDIGVKAIEQRKLKDITVIQGYHDVLLAQNQVFVRNFKKLMIDPRVDLVTCNGVCILDDIMIISYMHSVVLLEFSKDIYYPIKDVSFPHGTIAGITHFDQVVLIYTNCGGIYEFNHVMEEPSRFVLILQPSLASKVISSTTCSRKPWMFYSLEDKTINLFNYMTHRISFIKQCLESCLSMSLHPSSLYLLVSFPEKVTIYEVLHNDLIVYKDINIRWCKNVKFCSGGHMFALTINNVIQLFDFWNVTPITTFKGHSTNIVEIHFDYRDMYMFSTGTDGSLYTWNLLTNVRDNDYVLKGGNPIETCWLNENSLIMLQSDRTLKEVVSNAVVNQINLLVPCVCLEYIKSASVIAVHGTDGKSYIYQYPFTYSQTPLMILDGHSTSINKCDAVFNHGKLLLIDDDRYLSIWTLKNIDFAEPQFTDEIVVTKEEMDNQYQRLEALKLKTEEKKMELQYQLQVKKSLNEKKLQDSKRQHEKEMEMLRYEHDMELQEYLVQERQLIETLKSEDEIFQVEKQDIESHYQQLLLFEYDKQQTLRDNLQALKEKYDLELMQQNKELDNTFISKEREYKLIEAELELTCTSEDERLKKLEHKLNMVSRLQEEEISTELLEIKNEYDEKNRALDDERFKIQAEHNQVLRVCEQLEKEIHLQDQEIVKFDKEEKENLEELKSLEKILLKKQSDLKNIDLEISGKDDKINELKRKQQELEKYRFVVDYKLKELQDQVDPKRKEIKQLTGLIEQVKLDELTKKQQVVHSTQKLKEIEAKIGLEKKELEKEQEKHNKLQLFEKRMLYKFKQMTKLTNKKDIKLKMRELALEFEQLDELSPVVLNENEQQVLIKQRDSIQKQIQMTRARIGKQDKNHQQQMSKLLKENMTLVEQVEQQREDE